MTRYTYKRCPKCKGKLKYSALVNKYFCWECEKYYEKKDILYFFEK